MFERYTERARRALFFARFEASQFGGPAMTPVLLLLGLLKASGSLTTQVLAHSGLQVDDLRRELEEQIEGGEKVATSVEIPFDAASKRVLQYAAEEADRLLHDDIGTEHLLLGILREEKTLAADFLAAKGLQIDNVRQRIVDRRREGPPPGTDS